MDYFVTAIGTDSGKTIVSAILVEALKADYWKPIQSGMPRDTETVQSLITNKISRFWPESYLLNTPASPHASAKIDGVEIELTSIRRPETSNKLVIEGAGGLMVPINDQDYVIDIASRIPCEIILVSNLYLGSINHTLLSLEYLQSKKMPVKGLIFNGLANEESQRIIAQKSQWPVLFHLPQETEMTSVLIKEYADKIREIL